MPVTQPTTLHEKDAHVFLLALQQKNEQAFSDLYDRYAPALLGAIKRLIRDHQCAEDILQDTFLNIFQHVHQYDPGKGRMITWMLCIARNEAIDYLRSRLARVARNSEELSAKLSEKSNRLIFGFETAKFDLNACLPMLGFRNQRLIGLILAGYTMREIALITHLPEGTVKTHARRLYAQIRVLLN